MKHASLFTGIGGFDLAAELMGWQNVFHCEKENDLRLFLQSKFKKSFSYADIRETDFTFWRGRIDVLSGGFPCQPYSTAGKRLGTDDERHLWPEMLRAITEIRPRWIVGENVRGLINWSNGLVFEHVQVDLENAGYKVFPFLLPAAGVNAPHERYRVYFVAYSGLHGHGDKRRPEQTGSTEKTSCGQENQRKRFRVHFGRTGATEITANANAINGNGAGFRSGSKSQFKKAKILGGKINSNTNGERCCKPYPPGIAAIPGLRCRFRDGTTVEELSGGHRRWIHRGTATYSISKRLREENNRKRESRLADLESTVNDWRNFPVEQPVCPRNDGLPTELVRERIRTESHGCLTEKEIDKIISKAATEAQRFAIAGGGNAVVPQVVLQIFKSIEEYEKL